MILSEKKTGRVRGGEVRSGGGGEEQQQQGESCGVTLVEKHETRSRDLSRRGQGGREGGEERLGNGVASSLHVAGASSSPWKGDEGPWTGGVYTPGGGHLTCALQQPNLPSGSFQGGLPPSSSSPSSGVYTPQPQQLSPAPSSLVPPSECHHSESSSCCHLPLPTPPSYTAIIIPDNPPLLEFPPHPSPLLHFRHENSNNTTQVVNHPVPSLPAGQPSDALLPSPPLPHPGHHSSSSSSSFFPSFSYHSHLPTISPFSSPAYYQSPSSHPAAYYHHGYQNAATTTTTTPVTCSSPEEKGLLPSPPPSYIHSGFHASSPLPLPQLPGVSPHDVWLAENKNDKEIETQRRQIFSKSHISSSCSSTPHSTTLLLPVEKKKNENGGRGVEPSQKTAVRREMQSREEEQEEEGKGEKKEEKERRASVKELSEDGDEAAKKTPEKKETKTPAPQGEEEKEKRLSEGVVERESTAERKGEHAEKDEDKKQEGSEQSEREKEEKEKTKLGRQKEGEEEVAVGLSLTSTRSSIFSCAPQRNTDTQDRSMDFIALAATSSEETREGKEKKDGEKRKERGISFVSESMPRSRDTEAQGRKEKRVRRSGESEAEGQKRSQREEEQEEKEECLPSPVTKSSGSTGGNEEEEEGEERGVFRNSSRNERGTFFSELQVSISLLSLPFILLSSSLLCSSDDRWSLLVKSEERALLWKFYCR